MGRPSSFPLCTQGSDARARAIVLHAAFGFLRALAARRAAAPVVARAVAQLLELLAAVAEEYEELCGLLLQPLTLGGQPAAAVGAVAVPAARGHGQWLDRVAVLRAALLADQVLLCTALAHIEALLAPHPGGGLPGPEQVGGAPGREPLLPGD